MQKVYIAAPMFSLAELEYNEMISNRLCQEGFEIFLPQRSGYRMIELMERMTPQEARKMIFDKDIAEVEKADIIVIVLDGRTIDEGACVELGYGFAHNKKCYGLKTDPRTMMNGQINPMVSECLIKICTSINELALELRKELGQ